MKRALSSCVGMGRCDRAPGISDLRAGILAFVPQGIPMNDYWSATAPKSLCLSHSATAALAWWVVSF
jgi:hypothetical protein